jgi:hypothetical protein
MVPPSTNGTDGKNGEKNAISDNGDHGEDMRNGAAMIA